MIKAKFALPDRKVPITPLPSQLAFICVECGNYVTPLFYRGQWRKRACPCVIQKLRQNEREAQETAWREKTIQNTYAWLYPTESSLNALQHMYSQSFSTFDVTRQPIEKQPKFQEALNACERYAQNPQGNLALWGTTGVGKTHLLRAICNALREEHHTLARFVVFSEFVNAWQHASDEEQERLRRIARSAKLLVWDDVDTVTPSEARERIYFEVLNYRCDAGLPIALSANIFFPVVGGTQEHPGLVRYVGEKAMSRLKANLTIVGLEGIDQREGKQ